MEAHNGLMRKIVEEAGFAGIWGSGLAISAAYGVRDNNEASWTQVLETVEFMSDATDDSDSAGCRHGIRKFQQRSTPGPQSWNRSKWPACASRTNCFPKPIRSSTASNSRWPIRSSSPEKSRRPKTRSGTLIFASSHASKPSSPAGD